MPIAQEDLETLVQQLGDPKDSRVRYAAYQRLRSQSPGPLLKLLLRDMESWILPAQSYGFSLVQSTPLDLQTPALHKLTRSKSPFLQLMSAVTLHRRQEAGMLRRIVKVLEEAREGDAELQRYLVQRLSYLEEPEVARVLRSYIRKDCDYDVLDSVLYYFSITGRSIAGRDVLDTSELRAQLRKLCDDGAWTPEKRLIVESFLLAFADPAAELYLLGSLAEANSLQLSRASKFLQRAENVSAKLLELFAKRLEDETNVSVQSTLIRILGEQRFFKARKAIEKLIESENSMVSGAAFDALAKLGGATDTDLLRRLLNSQNNSLVVRAAEALRRLDDETGLPALQKIARAAGSDRISALDALGGFRRAEVVDLLLDAMADSDGNVRSTAERSLGMVLRGLFPYRRIDIARTGYAAHANAAARQQGLAQLREWWTQRKP
jgi:HEAT repeat protein